MVRRYLVLALLLWAGTGCGNPDEGTSGQGLLAKNEMVKADPFDENQVAHYQIDMDQSGWDAMVANPRDQSVWRRCTLTWQGQEVYYNVAIRPAGHSSAVAGFTKMGFHLKFNYYVPHRKFHSIYTPTIKMIGDHNDPAMIRRRIEDGVYRAAGIPAPLCVNCTLSVNGQSKGLYEVEELMKRGFIKKHFGRDNMNQLFAWKTHHPNDVIWFGPDPASQYTTDYFTPKLKKLDPLHPEVILPFSEVIRGYVSTVNLDPWSRMSQGIDTDMFCRFMAGEVLTGEGDGYVCFKGIDPASGYRSGNFRVYPDQNSRKFIALPWDRDQGYWIPRDSVTTGFDQRILTNQIILGNPETLAQFKAMLGGLVRGACSLDVLNARVDFIFNQVQAAAYADTLKLAGSNTNWVFNVQTIKNYITQHYNMILSQTP